MISKFSRTIITVDSLICNDGKEMKDAKRLKKILISLIKNISDINNNLHGPLDIEIKNEIIEKE